MTAEASAIDNATQPKVIIRCLVYNHEPYLRDCLEGFVMQKTNFPFKAVVHDDCSTDGSASIIREYAEKYPDIIEPIYETENQYSKRDGSLGRIMDAATLGRSPYIAHCEGDDYWIDPLKLQKQVDYMDKHPECTMTCTNAEVLTEKGFLSPDDFKSMGWETPCSTGNLSAEQIALGGGWFLHTCTLVTRSDIKSDMPNDARYCGVGDYPLQIFAALKGNVFYLEKKMAVYRFQHKGSWTERSKKDDFETLFNRNIKLVRMFCALNSYSNGKHEGAFTNCQTNIVLSLLQRAPQHRRTILSSLGWVLKYEYQARCREKRPTSFISKAYFNIKRLLAYPYHPHSIRWILPTWHPIILLKQALKKLKEKLNIIPQ